MEVIVRDLEKVEEYLKALCSVKPNRRTGSPGNRTATDEGSRKRGPPRQVTARKRSGGGRQSPRSRPAFCRRRRRGHAGASNVACVCIGVRRTVHSQLARLAGIAPTCDGHALRRPLACPKRCAVAHRAVPCRRRLERVRLGCSVVGVFGTARTGRRGRYR